MLTLLLSAALHIQNPQFDPAKPPILDEAKPVETYSAPEWEQASIEKTIGCGKAAAWRTDSAGTIEVAAIKEKKVPVKGKFTRFVGTLRQEGKVIRGKGALDLSSWDSQLAPRDYRVVKYVFGVEEQGQSVVPVKIEIQGKQASIRFTFRGFESSLKAKVVQGKDTLTLKTDKPFQFSFLPATGLNKESRLTAFQKLMELCNHQFLAGFAEISLDIPFRKICP